MRVAQVLGSSTGGMGRHVLSLVRGLVARGQQVDVYAPEMTLKLFDFEEAGASTTAVEIPANPGPQDVAAVRVLRQGLRTSPDTAVIHAHGMRAGVVASLARPAGLPFVVTWHATVPLVGLRRVAHGAAARAVVRSADVILAASEELADRAAQLDAKRVQRVMIVAPPLPAPTRDPAEVRAEFDIAPDRPLILSVGRLHRHKRHDVLVDAAARWRGRTPVPAVLIAGTGPEYRHLVAQAAVNRAPVMLIGHRDDVADLLAAADLAVITSDAEGGPLFVQEVFGQGVPLVATAVTGIVDLALDAAELVTPGDVEAVDAAVQALLDDPNRRAVLGTAGRARAEQWPSEAESIQAVLAVYTDVTGQAQ